jgi:hypothetical protein
MEPVSPVDAVATEPVEKLTSPDVVVSPAPDRRESNPPV